MPLGNRDYKRDLSTKYTLCKKERGMSADTICKTIHQYNRELVSAQDMRKLQEIAEDYSRVKNYVYDRFGGIGSLSKLYPGYTVQNEMTESGLRTKLALPSVYFYLAVFDALGEIKGQWTRTKTKIAELISGNERFSTEEKHYLRFLLRISNIFESVLNHTPSVLPKEIQKQYDMLSEQVDTLKLHRYLCRQVRRYHRKPHTEYALGFSIAERAYRYADHGIYISTKEKRKRIFIPLTDNNQYNSQLYIKLYPDQCRIEIKAPIYVAVNHYQDYLNQIGISFGMNTMLTTDKGNCYGEELGRYQREYADWMRKQTGSYNRNRKNNPGRKKYKAKKRRFEEQLHSYINHELNRLLKIEKPQTIYMVKLPRPHAGSTNRRVNHSLAMWQRGYIRSRLSQKCRENSVNLVEVLGKDISNECSCCTAVGIKKDGIFSCPFCGYCVEEKTNTARNVLNRGMDGKVLN